MAWNATLVDGPLEGREVRVEEESSNDVPTTIEVEGQLYLYCGFSDNAPRYRFDREAKSV